MHIQIHTHKNNIFNSFHIFVLFINSLPFVSISWGNNCSQICNYASMFQRILLPSCC